MRVPCSVCVWGQEMGEDISGRRRGEGGRGKEEGGEDEGEEGRRVQGDVVMDHTSSKGEEPNSVSMK